jgi:predicted SAM-dependent methyltransferase
VSKLNLGCENEYRKGWVNLDIDKKAKADVYHNLNTFPYPFKNDEFDVVLASHILEHLEDVEKVMKEIYRICKNRGQVYLEVPHFSNPFGLSSQLDHKHLFSYVTFGEWHCNKELFTMFEVMKKKYHLRELILLSLTKLLIHLSTYSRYFMSDFFLICFQVQQLSMYLE